MNRRIFVPLNGLHCVVLFTTKEPKRIKCNFRDGNFPSALLGQGAQKEGVHNDEQLPLKLLLPNSIKK